jgi:hypothetical protein
MKRIPLTLIISVPDHVIEVEAAGALEPAIHEALARIGGRLEEFVGEADEDEEDDEEELYWDEFGDRI